MDGIFLVKKPLGWSSYKVVGYLKRKFNLKKVGHGGTLDPLATGLLIVMVGKATKKFDEFQKLKKEYEAVIEFGRETDTLDKEGRVVFEYKSRTFSRLRGSWKTNGQEKVRDKKDFKLKKSDLEKTLKKFKGEIKQLPPIFSALKVKGKPAYKLARGGKKPKLTPRKATIYKASILGISGKRARIVFKVSSGTYIRSLARDIGKKMGFGGYLYSLKRTSIGKFDLKKAKSPEKIILKDFMVI